MTQGNGHLGGRFIFGGGAPRSGTGLVQNILDSHPQIYGGPEFGRTPTLVELYKKMCMGGGVDFFYPPSQMTEWIRELFCRIFLPHAVRNGAEWISEMTPFNVMVFSDLMDLFPEARFVLVIRDPRAVVSSLLQVAERARQKGNPPPGVAATLQDAMQCVLTCAVRSQEALRKDSSRVIIVQYENLVQNPEREIKSLSASLGVEFFPEMLHPGEKKHDAEIALDGVWYDRQMFYRDPDPSEIDKWKRLLTPEQQRLVTTLFQQVRWFQELGYCFNLE